MARISTTADELRTAAPADEEIVSEDTAARQAGGVRGFLTGPYPTLISRLALGVIFFLSGLTKLGVAGAFAATINSYELSLPQGLVQAMAVGLPVIEIGLGVWLLAGLFLRFSALLSGIIMLVFLVAVAQAWARGLDINCGCFAGPDGNPLGLALVGMLGPVGTWLQNEKAGPEAVIRDTVLLLMAVHIFLIPSIFSLDNLRNRYRQDEVSNEE
ncbi:MAG: DoxX family protein [Chloroflexia bacterium]